MGARPVWRVRDRASFDALRRDGRRARRGPISVTVAVPDAPEAGGRPRVAFSVGRRVGSAVVRNRARRRLRAVVDDLARGDTVAVLGEGAGGGVSGTWLVSARSDLSELSALELRSVVASALCAAAAA
jgi:ribonuclease P protein component